MKFEPGNLVTLISSRNPEQNEFVGRLAVIYRVGPWYPGSVFKIDVRLYQAAFRIDYMIVIDDVVLGVQEHQIIKLGSQHDVDSVLEEESYEFEH